MIILTFAVDCNETTALALSRCIRATTPYLYVPAFGAVSDLGVVAVFAYAFGPVTVDAFIVELAAAHPHGALDAWGSAR